LPAFGALVVGAVPLLSAVFGAGARAGSGGALGAGPAVDGRPLPPVLCVSVVGSGA
jgi:hypothetical protein